MNTEIRYFTKSKKGNTEKLANQIAKATGKKALTVATDLSDRVDRLFLVNAMYAANIDKEVKDFEKRTGINITKQASAANDKYLQSNGEKEGEKTYQVPQNEYVDFYLMYFSKKGGKNA